MSYQSYRVPWWNAVVFGAAAFLAGYFLSWHLLSFGSLPTIPNVEIPNTSKVGWSYYNSHRVPITATLSVPGGERGEVGRLNWITSESSPDYYQFMFVIPYIFTAWAGFASASTAPQTSRLSYIVANGASIAIGYGLIGIIGAFVFSYTESGLLGSTTIGPSLGQTVVMLPLHAIAGGITGGVLYVLLSGSVSVQLRSTGM